jgi:hypothetical protein
MNAFTCRPDLLYTCVIVTVGMGPIVHGRVKLLVPGRVVKSNQLVKRADS